MPLEALSNHEIETDLLDDLVEKGLARQVDSENYDVHDLVREFLLRTFDSATATTLHAAACAWYRKRLDAPEQQLEYIYHLVNSGDSDSLGDVLDESGRSLVRSGHMELLPLLIELQESQFGPRTWATVLEMRGDILAMQGRWDDAETEYESCLPIVKRHKMREMEGRLLSSKADLSVHRGDSDSALDLHGSALQIFIDTKDAKGAARTYTNMGYIFRHRKKIRSVRSKSMVTSKSYSNLKPIQIWSNLESSWHPHCLKWEKSTVPVSMHSPLMRIQKRLKTRASMRGHVQS